MAMHARLIIVKFLQKTRLNKVVHKLYYGYIHGFNTSGPKGLLPALESLFAKAKELGTGDKGDYYEFGIFKGYAFLQAQNFAKKQGFHKTRFFGFDSFQGLPEIKGRDIIKDEVFYKGQYSCPKEKVVKNLTKAGIDWDKAFLVEGYFEDSLTEHIKQKHSMNKVTIALIDCDIYSSTVEVLNFIVDLLMDKSILMFDDWNCFDRDNEKGQRKAFSEFLAQHPEWEPIEILSYGLYGLVFLMRRKSH